MILWFKPTDKQIAEWKRWLDERPSHVRAVAERFNPWTLYRLTTTGQRCSVIGFHETTDPSKPVTAYIHAENPTLGRATARNVFGIDPATLVPWTNGDEPPHAFESAFGEQRFDEAD